MLEKICVHMEGNGISQKLIDPETILQGLLELPHDKTNKMTVHPVKTQISLGIRPV